MEYKSFGFKLDGKEATEQRIIKGYGSTFEPPENADCYDDILLPGAFDKTIEEDFKAGRVKLFNMHWQPIGMPLVLRADAKGLYLEARISKTSAGDDALELAVDGVLSELSIGFDPIEFDFIVHEGKKVRRLKSVKLYEVSLVPWGANPYAQLTGAIKSFGRSMETREGRVLSKSNFGLLLSARDALDTVIAAAAKTEDGDKSLPLPPHRVDESSEESSDQQPINDQKAFDAIAETLEQLKAILTA